MTASNSKSAEPEGLVRSKQRVADHGEVFTPSWMVEDMLDLVKSETERIDSRFLEPACGSGNFLKVVLIRKLHTVETCYKKSEFERRHYALLALMSIYGIELLADNLKECHQNLLKIFTDFLSVPEDSVWVKAALAVLRANIAHGDALTLMTSVGSPIEFPEWGYLGNGKFQRRDFHYENLTDRAIFKGPIFDSLEEQDFFIPTKAYAPMTVQDIAE